MFELLRLNPKRRESESETGGGAGADRESSSEKEPTIPEKRRGRSTTKKKNAFFKQGLDGDHTGSKRVIICWWRWGRRACWWFFICVGWVGVFDGLNSRWR